MLLPASVQQTIEQIIAATPDITPELRQPMADELHEQFEALIAQTIIRNLPRDQANIFRQLLEEQPNPNQIKDFLDSYVPNMDDIMNQAAEDLKRLYLG